MIFWGVYINCLVLGFQMAAARLLRRVETLLDSRFQQELLGHTPEQIAEINAYVAAKKAVAVGRFAPYAGPEHAARLQSTLHETEIEIYNEAGVWYRGNKLGGSNRMVELFQVFVTMNSACAAVLDLIPKYDVVHSLPYDLYGKQPKHIEMFFSTARDLYKDECRTPEELIHWVFRHDSIDQLHMYPPLKVRKDWGM